ncbi:MAG: PDZ domain-containing protein [Actinomycetes bacterium]
MAGFAAVDTLDAMVTEGDEVDPMVDGSDGEIPFDDVDSDDDEGLSRWWIVAIVAVLVILAAVLAAAFIKVPYFLLSPGSVRETETLIEVQGAPTYPIDGEVGFTTVTVQSATALNWALAKFDDSVTIVPEELILGKQSHDENLQANIQMMSDSKEIASAVALTQLGYKVSLTGTGAFIVEVPDDSPSKGLLTAGDTVVSVNGVSVTRSDELVATLGTYKPGDQVTLSVQPYRADGTRVSEDRVVTLGARPNDASKAYLGVSSVTRDPKYDLPVQISVDSGSVGGPSAGLAFTLGIMDVMTEGSITGGHKIATTGTIEPNGHVGEVGGVHQKTIAVRDSGAELFLVPRSEFDEAEKYAGSLRVEPVDSIDDALRILATFGGGSEVIPKNP